MIFVDANVLLRFITKQPAEQAEQARALLKRGQQGELELKVLPLTLAEVYHVLRRLYKFAVEDIKDVLVALISSQAFEVEHETAMLSAVHNLGSRIDFEDSYLAARAFLVEGSVASFDKDFDKLGVRCLDPAQP